MNRKNHKFSPFARPPKLEDLPQPLPVHTQQKLVKVYVEGYEDVAFWRCIFDNFRTPYLRFEISVPERGDLPKGKKVLLRSLPNASAELLLCVDSDFDYLFAGRTEESKAILEARYMFHTYTYATENYLCWAPSLHNVCVKATKNDMRIFDFERFLAEYSRTIYPLFLWYAFSAQLTSKHIFPLIEFKASVRLGYLDIEENGAGTLAWLRRNVEKRLHLLESRNPSLVEPLKTFERQLRERGLQPEQVYLYMHGHTLLDNVVMILLNTVCEKLRQISIAKIHASEKEGVALKNELSNYANAQQSVHEVLLDNDNYTDCPLYKRLQRDLTRYIARTILEMKHRGEIQGREYLSTLAALRKALL